MKTTRTALGLRSQAALEEQAAVAARMNGHRLLAARYLIRSIRHEMAANKLDKAVKP